MWRFGPPWAALARVTGLAGVLPQLEGKGGPVYAPSLHGD
jgi:hypothetical protein